MKSTRGAECLSAQVCTVYSGPRDNVGNHEFFSLNWLPFPTRVKYFNGVYTFKVRSGLAPRCLAEHFLFISDDYSHNLRQSSSNFSLAFCNSPTGTFQRSAVSEWNALPMELKSIQSLPSFKLKLKQFLQLSWNAHQFRFVFILYPVLNPVFSLFAFTWSVTVLYYFHDYGPQWK